MQIEAAGDCGCVYLGGGRCVAEIDCGGGIVGSRYSLAALESEGIWHGDAHSEAEFDQV